MISVKALRVWLATLDDHTEVGISDDGQTLQTGERDEHGDEDPGAHLVVGGMPEWQEWIRQRGDDDGVEYGDPRDALEDRLWGDV